jgi:hypothetical protein
MRVVTRLLITMFIKLMFVHESVHRDTTVKITNKLHYID